MWALVSFRVLGGFRGLLGLKEKQRSSRKQSVTLTGPDSAIYHLQGLRPVFSESLNLLLETHLAELSGTLDTVLSTGSGKDRYSLCVHKDPPSPRVGNMNSVMGPETCR
jgi:hypothetical protein